MLNIIPVYLRKHFIERWNDTNPDKPWKRNEESGSNLISEISDGVKRKSKFKDYRQRLESGNENEWDITSLAYIMLDCGLSMFHKSRDDVQTFRSIRNSHFAHACSMSCSASSFKHSVAEIISAAENIFGKEAANKIREYTQKKQKKRESNGKPK